MSTSARMLRLLSLLQTHRYCPAGSCPHGSRSARGPCAATSIGSASSATPSTRSAGSRAATSCARAGSCPPLLLEDDEAVAIAVALRTATSGGEDTSLQALTKVIALMPPRLRRRMDAVRSQTDGVPWAGGPTIDASVLTTLAQACRDDEPVAFDYTARDGEGSRRRVEPHRLVSVGRRWYVVAYDRDRQDWRSFRVDRVSGVQPSGQRFRPRELPAPDAPSFVEAGIRSMATRYDVRLRIALPAEVVEADLGRWATVTPDGEGCRVRLATETLDWPLMVLARLDADFAVEGPDELRAVIASGRGPVRLRRPAVAGQAATGAAPGAS